ncbi:MAG TPA: polysaccharide pyruvyl transferase family protein, partial [Anaerolineales bacterium]|nr:polysaccharide pyruvyl transferase family protein [Anaerolineales bacterium]
MISHLGTFDVENYGDLLYPIVLSHLLKNQKVHHYSPLPVKAPLEAGFETDSITSLFAPDTPAHTIVIGGGDILRADWNTFASHYSTNSHSSYDSLRRSIGTFNAFNYLVRRKIPRGNPAAFFAHRFRNSRLNYAATGPFLIDSDKLPRGSSISYLSCGVPHEFAATERASVKRIFNQASFIYLRDEQSAEKLRQT